MNINARSILYFLYFPSLLMWIKEREISHLRLVSEDSIPLIFIEYLLCAGQCCAGHWPTDKG